MLASGTLPHSGDEDIVGTADQQEPLTDKGHGDLPGDGASVVKSQPDMQSQPATPAAELAQIPSPVDSEEAQVVVPQLEDASHRTVGSSSAASDGESKRTGGENRVRRYW